MSKQSPSPFQFVMPLLAIISIFMCIVFARNIVAPQQTPSPPVETNPLPFLLVVIGIGLIVGLVFLNREMKRRRKKEKYPRDSIIQILNKRRSRDVYSAVALCLIAVIVSTFIPQSNSPEIHSIQLVLCLIMIILLSGKLALEYRIVKGWYGNNEREAREIIEFIIKESSNIDFRDGGKLKKILSDEDLEEIKLLGLQPVPGTD